MFYGGELKLHIEISSDHGYFVAGPPVYWSILNVVWLGLRVRLEVADGQEAAFGGADRGEVEGGREA
jgi:hypothetical protein